MFIKKIFDAKKKKYLMVKIFYAKIVLIQKKIDAKKFSYKKILVIKNF